MSATGGEGGMESSSDSESDSCISSGGVRDEVRVRASSASSSSSSSSSSEESRSVSISRVVMVVGGEGTRRRGDRVEGEEVM